MLRASRNGRLAGRSDAELITLAREGSEPAFEALVRRHRAALLRHTVRLGVPPPRADDVLQRALLRAWLALRRGTEVREPRAWLYRITRNSAIDAIRAPAEGNGGLERLGEDGEAVVAGGAVGDGLELRETLAQVAALPEMQRDALLLSAVDGRSYEEVARALGISEGAVRGLLHRARSSLRAAAGALAPPLPLAWAAARPRTVCAPSGASASVSVLRGSALAIGAAAAVAGGSAVVAHKHHSHGAAGTRHAAAKVAGGVAPVSTAAEDAAVRTPGGPAGHAGSSPGTGGTTGSSSVSSPVAVGNAHPVSPQSARGGAPTGQGVNRAGGAPEGAASPPVAQASAAAPPSGTSTTEPPAAEAPQPPPVAEQPEGHERSDDAEAPESEPSGDEAEHEGASDDPPEGHHARSPGEEKPDR